MNIFRVIHISNICFNNDDKSKFIINKLIEDLNIVNNETRIDMIFITGDLIYKGGINFESAYEAFKCFEEKCIKPIENQLKITRDRIFFAPGNHDVNKNKDKEYVEIGLNSYLNSNENVKRFICDNGKLDTDVEGIKRLSEYKRFEQEFYKGVDIKKYFSNFESTYIIDINGHSVGISSLNTVWRFYNNKSKLLLGEQQIQNSIDIIKKCDFKLALMHNSYELLDEMERRSVKEKIQNYYDYLFVGHVYNSEIIKRINMEKELFISATQSSKNSLEYSILDINVNELLFYNRIYSDLRSKYEYNEFSENKNYKKFDLSNSELVECSKQHNQIIEILEDKIEELNEDLLIYSTDSKAPKDLNEIFIEPNLEYANDYESEMNNDKKTLNVQDIINSTNDTLILGTKESGKTILIDKIIVELIQKSNSYNILPVKLNFINIKNIKKSIKNYLGLSNKALEKVLKKNIVLIIENLEYNEENLKIIDNIKELKKQYANIRIIFTMRIQSESSTPIKIMEDNFLKDFQRVYIKNWNYKNIEKLTDIWFEESKNSINLNDIISIFSSLKITANPLNISMLLWIIEHQTDYSAINNAKLLETFFEHLLQKLDPSEICSSKFDYSNKIRLLSEIALYIYEDNTYDEYRVQAVKLDSFVNAYLEKRKFSSKYKSVMELFKERGILLYEEIYGVETVRFRFECFFRYFLMQNMINSEEFRIKVISEENYLKFEDEIEYFTGIKRDQEMLLKELNDRMMNVYHKHIETIKKQRFSFDSLLEVSDAFTNRIDCKDKDILINIKKITPEIELKMSNEKLENNNRQSEQISKRVEHDEVIEVKKDKGSDLQELFITWNIVAKVLKNTEEIENGQLKNDIYRNVLKCSIIFCIINKLLMEQIMQDEKISKSDERYKELLIDSRCILFTHQILLREVLGSQKLEIVFQEEITKMLKEYNAKSTLVSEAELYTSIFLLLDINKNLGIELVQKFIKIYKRNYIKDMLYLKLSWHYKMNLENEVLDRKYLSMIREVLDKKQSPKKKERTGDTLNQFKHNKMLQEHLLN